MGKKSNKIDFVVLWVDGSDPKWRAEKEKWEKKLGIASEKNMDSSDVRYRDYGLLRYWFRGVEKFAPWVNKIHFVTCGHLPEWLNITHPKLHVVKHADFIPKDALPVFNCNSIELLLHKIEGLSEQFVYFNDDFFILRPVKPSDFFKKEKPSNTMALHPIFPTNPVGMSGIAMNNVGLINNNFVFRSSVGGNLLKYLSVRQGKYLLKTLPLLGYKMFPGFATFHMPNSYTKATLEEVWRKEGKNLLPTVYRKFRDYEKDYTQWLFNYWQFASGDFVQRSVKFGINTSVENPSLPNLIRRQKAKCINIGDSNKVDNFLKTKNLLSDAFDEILPDRCSFEREDRSEK